MEQKSHFRRIGDDAVIEATGKGWADWLAILDAWDVPAIGHTRTAKRLREELGVSPWWAQAVTIRYEWERGLRQPTDSSPSKVEE